MKHLIGAILLAGLLSSCATQSFDINPAVGPVGEPALETSQPFFIGGIGQTATLDAARICGGADKIARVETETTFLDGLLSAIAGIYSPRTARVYCTA